MPTTINANGQRPPARPPPANTPAYYTLPSPHQTPTTAATRPTTPYLPPATTTRNDTTRRVTQPLRNRQRAPHGESNNTTRQQSPAKHHGNENHTIIQRHTMTGHTPPASARQRHHRHQPSPTPTKSAAQTGTTPITTTTMIPRTLNAIANNRRPPPTTVQG